MVEYSRNITGGIPAYRTLEPSYHFDSDTAGEGMRYTAGYSVNGMEWHPDYYNGKTEPPKLRQCVTCGKAILSQRGKYCEQHAVSGRAATYMETMRRKKAEMKANALRV